MGIVRALSGAIGGTFADQWKEIITAGAFDEYTVVVPGILQQTNAGRGTNFNGSDGVISNGSKIFVPEGTAAFVFSQSGIELVITEPGGYEYENGQATVFDGDTAAEAILTEALDRIGFGGQTSDQKRISFVNLREIRGLKFGTRGPLLYHDLFYETDLEILAFGSFSVQVVDAPKFVRSFVPANVTSYSFYNPQTRAQITSEFLQSFIDALNSLSKTYRISEVPGQAEEIAAGISADSSNAGTWVERFGFKLVSVGIENIEFTAASRELVNTYSSNRMSLKAYEGLAPGVSDIGAQQKIAQGVQDHGLGDGAGLIVGMGLAQGMTPPAAAPRAQDPALSLDEQIAAVKQLKELLDAGALTEEEFELKKREVMGL